MQCLSRKESGVRFHAGDKYTASQSTGQKAIKAELTSVNRGAT